MTDKQREKTFADLSAEQQGIIRGGEALGELIQMKQWEFFEKILRKHLEQNRAVLENRAPDMNSDGIAHALRTEHLKGTIIGIRLALELPSITMKAAKDLRKQLLGAEGTS